MQSLPQVPQWVALLVRFTHPTPAQFVKPVLQTETHVVPLHAQTEFAGSVPLHVPQPPEQQIELVPHDVPSVALPVEPQVCDPVEQDVVPVWQALPPGEHATPAVQATQVPLPQTMLVPHEVPFATLPVAPHVDVPVEQDVRPVWQTLPPGLHGWLAVHAPHWPEPLHTPPLHAVPALAVPVCVQTGAPVVHETDPVRQGLPPGLHAAPVEQAAHVPPLQTSLVPHGVPSATLPVAAHVAAPVEHDVVPAAHGFPPGAHDAPAVHATQAPLLQTMFCPHDVPSAAFVPVSLQAIPPSAHWIAPTLQAALIGTQGDPFVQTWQAPALQ